MNLFSFSKEQWIVLIDAADAIPHARNGPLFETVELARQVLSALFEVEKRLGPDSSIMVSVYNGKPQCDKLTEQYPYPPSSKAWFKVTAYYTDQYHARWGMDVLVFSTYQDCIQDAVKYLPPTAHKIHWKQFDLREGVIVQPYRVFENE